MKLEVSFSALRGSFEEAAQEWGGLAIDRPLRRRLIERQAPYNDVLLLNVIIDAKEADNSRHDIDTTFYTVKRIEKLKIYHLPVRGVF